MAEIPQDDAEFNRVRKVGLLVLGAFGALFVLMLCGGGGWVGWSGYHSESAGVRAMYLVAAPLGGAFFGLVGAAAGHFLVKKSAAAKVAVPVVLGGIGGAGTLAATFVFFELIFPAL